MKKTLISILAAARFIYCNAQQIDSTALNNVFGKKGTVTGNVYKITFPRSLSEREHRALLLRQKSDEDLQQYR